MLVSAYTLRGAYWSMSFGGHLSNILSFIEIKCNTARVSYMVASRGIHILLHDKHGPTDQPRVLQG